jgi:hypothetical protein
MRAAVILLILGTMLVGADAAALIVAGRFEISSPGGSSADGFDIEIAGDFAYSVTNIGLLVFDISDPAAPVEIGRFGTGHHNGVDVVGDHAYLALGNFLWILDVSNPANPIQIGSVAFPTNADDVEVAGNRAYVGVSSIFDGELWVVDVSDPTLPVGIESAEVPNSIGDVDLAGDVILVGHSDGLTIFELFGPGKLREIGALSTPGGVNRIDVVGNIAYLATVVGTAMRIVDISDPTNPVELGTSIGHFGRSVKVAGNIAYLSGRVGSQPSALRMIDVSNPNAPVEVGSYTALPNIEESKSTVSGPMWRTSSGSGFSTSRTQSHRSGSGAISLFSTMSRL